MYLFVLEEAATRKIVGTAMIIAKHGTPESPHYYLEMATDQRYSKTLKTMFRHTYLTLRRSIDGPTEVGGLIVDPAFRQHPAKIGKQLSFVRFLYLAMYPDRFEDEVIAEMMPPLTDNKESLFWECYGKRVTGLDFRDADKLSTKDKEFIETLFPSIPIYTCMLPVEVQKQIGRWDLKSGRRVSARENRLTVFYVMSILSMVALITGRKSRRSHCSSTFSSLSTGDRSLWS